MHWFIFQEIRLAECMESPGTLCHVTADPTLFQTLAHASFDEFDAIII